MHVGEGAARFSQALGHPLNTAKYIPYIQLDTSPKSPKQLVKLFIILLNHGASTGMDNLDSLEKAINI